MTKPIQKGIEKMSEVMINENKEQRNIRIEYLRQRQLRKVDNED